MKMPFSRTIKNSIKTYTLRRQLERENWFFSPFRISQIVIEEKEWYRAYAPVKVQGKTILDIGGGEGETARFYLKNGAAKVYVIECCQEAFCILTKNASFHHGVVPVNKRFELSDLKLQNVDFAKCDIEGYEEVLIGVEPTFPMVVEVHGLQLRDRFKEAGWLVEPADDSSKKDYGCIYYAYWKCKQSP